jgi:hypothetical protein
MGAQDKKRALGVPMLDEVETINEERLIKTVADVKKILEHVPVAQDIDIGIKELVTDGPPHPLTYIAVTQVARGFVEVPIKGGPDSAFIEIEMPLSEACARGVVVHGPERRSIIVDQIARRLMEMGR